jgi:hypothetical protein
VKPVFWTITMELVGRDDEGKSRVGAIVHCEAPANILEQADDDTLRRYFEPAWAALKAHAEHELGKPDGPRPFLENRDTTACN